MSAQWTQLYVKAPEGNQYITPQAMKRIDDHIGQLFAALKCPPPSGLPVQEPDGTWEVRVYQTALLSMVKSVLTGHYGLDIVREVPHD